MASRISNKLPVLVILFFLCSCKAKFNENKTYDGSAEIKTAPKKQNINNINMMDSPAMMFADELKLTLEKYLFGICPQSFKMGVNKKNNTSSCELDTEQHDLAGRLATLALRAHSASRVDCARFGVALANTLGELARTAATRQATSGSAAAQAAAQAAAAEAKKRKLSKSQKAKIVAKQRTALAVKKKAAALAAAAAAKMAS